MNKKRWIISIGAVVGLVLLFGFTFKPEASKGDQKLISGIVEQEEYHLSFKIGGRIGTITVEEGQHVTQGELLGTLEKGEWQAKVDQAQAAVTLASANVSKASTGVGVVDQTAQAKVDQAQAAVGLASANISKASTGVGVVDQTAQAKIEQAEAALKTAQAQMAQVQTGARPEEIAQLKAKVEATEKAYHNAEDMVGKINKLYEAGAVSESKKDEVELALEKVKAERAVAHKEFEIASQGARKEDLDKVRHQSEQAQGALNEALSGKGQVQLASEDVNIAKSQSEQAQGALTEALSGKGQVQLSSEDVNIAKSQVAQAEASLAEANTYLSYTELRAPIDGIIIHKQVKVGEMVSEGFTSVTLAQPQKKTVKFYVPENELNAVQVGEVITLNVPALADEVKATVEGVNPAPQFAVQKATNHLKDTDVRSFEVKVRVTEKTEQLLAGMTVQWVGTQP